MSNNAKGVITASVEATDTFGEIATRAGVREHDVAKFATTGHGVSNKVVAKIHETCGGQKNWNGFVKSKLKL